MTFSFLSHPHKLWKVNKQWFHSFCFVFFQKLNIVGALSQIVFFCIFLVCLFSSAKFCAMIWLWYMFFPLLKGTLIKFFFFCRSWFNVRSSKWLQCIDKINNISIHVKYPQMEFQSTRWRCGWKFLRNS